MLDPTVVTSPWPLTGSQTNGHLLGLWTASLPSLADSSPTVGASTGQSANTETNPTSAQQAMFVMVFLNDQSNRPSFQTISIFSFNKQTGVFLGRQDFTPGGLFAGQIFFSRAGNGYYNLESDGSGSINSVNSDFSIGAELYAASLYSSTYAFELSIIVALDEVANVLLNPSNQYLEVYQLTSGSLLYQLEMGANIIACCIVTERQAYVLCQNNILCLVDYTTGSVLNAFWFPPQQNTQWPQNNSVALFWDTNVGQLFVCEMIQSANEGNNASTISGYRMVATPSRLSAPIPLLSAQVGAVVPVFTQLLSDLNLGLGGTNVYAAVTGSGSQLGFGQTDAYGRARTLVSCTSEGSVAIDCTASVSKISGGSVILTNSGSFQVTELAPTVATVETMVMPAVSYPNGSGRLVHPVLGAFDYTYPPDEWTNLDGDILVLPTYAATKSLQGASVSLWQGALQDITCEERWLSLGGLAMPISQLRMLLACVMNPIDPAIGSMQWYPNYATDIGYNVLLLDVVLGSGGRPTTGSLSGFNNQAIVMNDLINALDSSGDVYGWVDKPVTVFWKLLGKVQVG